MSWFRFWSGCGGLGLALCLAVGPPLGCGTIAEGDGGGVNLPNRGIVPMNPLSPDDLPDGEEREGLPVILSHEQASLAEPDALAFEGALHLFVEVYEESDHWIERTSSADGIDFEPLRAVIEPELDWEETAVGAPEVRVVAGELWFWYVGGTTQTAIGLARSADALTWTRETTPVLVAEEGELLASPTVIQWDGRYVMYFASRTFDEEDEAVWTIQRADSNDGVSWTRRGAALETGTNCYDLAGDRAVCWDNGFVGHPEARVVETPVGRQVVDLWYSGGRSYGADIGFAGSWDGLSFSRYNQNPVIGNDDTERAASVVEFGGRVRLYYDLRTRNVSGIALAWDQ